MSYSHKPVGSQALCADTVTILTQSRPGYNVQRFTVGDLTFEDNRYTNPVGLDGIVTVESSDGPIWRAHYTGTFTDPTKCLISSILTFRRSAHRERKMAFQPFGPQEYVDGDFTYRCITSGVISEFSCREIIYFKNKSQLITKAFGRTLV